VADGEALDRRRPARGHAGHARLCVRPAAPLTYRLAEGGRWREAYRDELAVISVRRER
jgi:hypothetical protein